VKRYLLIVAGMIVFFLVFFVVVEALGIPLLSDPTPWMKHGGLLAAVVGVGLLVAGVLLLVPSTDPGNPRKVIDGQVYGVGYTRGPDNLRDFPPDPNTFVSVLVFNSFQGSPAWQNIQPFMMLSADKRQVLLGWLDADAPL
jgi:hypothetical protein